MHRFVLLLATVALVVGGCGSAERQSAGAVDRLAEARAMLPEQVRTAGRITAVTDPTFEPMTYVEGGKFVGLDMDILNAVADRLGLTVEWTSMPFGQLVDAVAEHGADVLMTSMFDKNSMFDKKKRQAKIDFVDYMNAGTSIVVRKGVGDIGGMPGLCGRRVAAQPDTSFVDMALAQQAGCGNRPLTVVLTATPSADVRDGKADAALIDYPIAVMNVSRMSTLELSGQQIDALPYGIGVAKDNNGLTTAIQTALYELFKDGTYDALLAKYQVNEGALRTGAINGGV